ncbi:MAG: HupE/UreJ family protein [Bacteroidota bacterium]
MIAVEIIKKYIFLGYTHVIPLGFDHILFIITIYLLSSNLKSALIQCSVFTIAHSISLGITASGFFVPNSRIVETFIALSILITAIQNIVQIKNNKIRLLVVFIFGLIHGMGFASALQSIGIPKSNFFTALVSFNIGVEFGQISIILIAYLLISKWFRKKSWYYDRIVFPISSIIACIALYWTINRFLY